MICGARCVLQTFPHRSECDCRVADRRLHLVWDVGFQGLVEPITVFLELRNLRDRAGVIALGRAFLELGDGVERRIFIGQVILRPHCRHDGGSRIDLGYRIRIGDPLGRLRCAF